MDKADPLIRKTVVLRQSMWNEIAAYRKGERIESEMEAVRRLLSTALKGCNEQSPNNPQTPGCIEACLKRIARFEMVMRECCDALRDQDGLGALRMLEVALKEIPHGK